MTLTDPQIRELARGVLTGYVSGTKEVPADADVDSNGVEAGVLIWVEIPDLAAAAQQYQEHTGKSVQEEVE